MAWEGDPQRPGATVAGGGGSTPSPRPTRSRSQEPQLAGPPLAPRSGGHWEAPAGDIPRERGAGLTRVRSHTPLPAVTSPPRLQLPLVSAALRHLLAAQPLVPQPLLSSAHLGVAV